MFEVNVHAERAAEHPKVFTHLTIEYVIGGKDLSKEAVERAVELSETKYCPAQTMFEESGPDGIEDHIPGEIMSDKSISTKNVHKIRP